MSNQNILKLHKIVQSNQDKFLGFRIASEVLQGHGEPTRNIMQILSEYKKTSEIFKKEICNTEQNEFVYIEKNEVKYYTAPPIVWQILETMLNDNCDKLIEVSKQRVFLSEENRNKLRIAVEKGYLNNKKIKNYVDLIFDYTEKIILKEEKEKINIIFQVCLSVIIDKINESNREISRGIHLKNTIENIGKSMLSGLMNNYLPLNNKIFEETKQIEEFLQNIKIILENSDNKNIVVDIGEEILKKYLVAKQRFKIYKKDTETIKVILLLSFDNLIKKLKQTDEIKNYSTILGKIMNSDFTEEKFLIYYETKIKKEIKTLNFEYGKLMFNQFYGTIFEEKRTDKIENGEIHTEITLKLLDESYLITRAPKLPRLSDDKNIKIQDRVINDKNYKFESIENIVHENYYLHTKIKGKEDFQNQSKSVKFTLNHNSCYKLISDLIQLKENKENMVKLIYSNEYSEILQEYIDPIDFELDVISLLKLSEIYGINFYEFAKNLNIGQKNEILVLKELINIATDLNDFSAISIKKIFENSIYNYNKIIVELTNKIYSTKLEINEILINIAILMHFKYYYFERYLDARGRIYAKSCALSYQRSKLARNLISFYSNKTLNNTGKTEKFLEILNLLKMQILSLFNIEISDKELLNCDIDNFLLKRNIKFQEYYSVYSLLYDLKNFIIFKEKYKFNSYYSQDASNSGTQQTAIVLKNKKLASFCKLISNSIDVYSFFIEGGLLKLHKKLIEAYNLIRKEFWREFLKVKDEFNDDSGAFIRAKTKSKQYELNYINYKNINVELNESEKKLLEEIEKYLNIKKIKDPKNFNSKITINQINALNAILDVCTAIYSLDWLEDFVLERSLAKKPIMSLPYGVTIIGINEQLEEFFFKKAIAVGKWISSHEIILIRKYIKIISKYFCHWARDKIPESFILLDFVIKNANKKNFIGPITIENKYIKTTYLNLSSNTARLAIGKKNGKRYNRLIIKFLTEGMDWRKFKQSYVPNFMHFCDAYIMRGYFDICHEKNILNFGVHDRFYIEAIYATELKDIVKQAIINLYNEDMLNKNLGTDKFINNETIGIDVTLKIEDLNNPDFIKH